MKKITVLAIALLFVASMGFAQRIATQSNYQVKNLIELSQAKVIDTLMPTSMLDTACGNHLTYYHGAGMGYVAGNNSYGDLEKAQKYYGTGTVSEVLGFVLTNTPTSSSNTYVKIYAISPTTKGPTGTALGTSTAVLCSALPTLAAPAYTSFTFGSPVSFTNGFACSFVMPTGATDTAFVITTNASRCTWTDSLSWEMESDANWYSINSMWQSAPSVPLKIDLALFPVADLAIAVPGSDQYFDGIQMSQNMPNPAVGMTSVEYALQTPGNVTFEVFDLSGKKSVVINDGYQLTGNHKVTFDCSKLSKGVYYYSIISDNKRMTKKMVID